MRISPFLPEKMSPEVRYVHDEVVNLVTRSQNPVTMLNGEGALIGPFPPMFHFPQFGIPALSFIRSLDTHATLSKKVREVAILSVGSVFGARFELYAHEIMAEVFGFSEAAVASLASGNKPIELNEEESIAFEFAHALAQGKILSDSVYAHSTKIIGKEGTAELIFLIGAYAFLAMVLNGFDVPLPEVTV